MMQQCVRFSSTPDPHDQCISDELGLLFKQAGRPAQDTQEPDLHMFRGN